jgi:hypothetical protein
LLLDLLRGALEAGNRQWAVAQSLPGAGAIKR